MVHNYTVSGSLILTEEWGTNLVVYLYDANGAPIGMRYRTSSMAEGVFYTFWFDKNLQGDVVAVYTETGTKVLSYIYDAWGNKTTTVHNSSGTNSYAQYNAITYRGYYFDSETNLYYVSSRYYDPAIGRFVNADAVGLLGANGDFTSLNMFAYCGNNPVSREDDGGEFWHIVIGAAVGAVVSFASSVISDIVSDEEIDWAGAAISAAFGAAGGALAATGLGAVAQVAGGAVLAGAENVIEQGRENGFDNIDYGEVAVSSIVGGVTSRNNGVSKDVSNHLYKQAAVATKRLKTTRRCGGVTAMMKAIKPTIKYYFSQTSTLFYKPLINDSVSTLVSDAKDSIRDSLYITAS